MRSNKARAIGTSNHVQIFLVSDGARFSTNFLFGRSIHELRNVPLIRSLDSLTVMSGSQMISMVGRALTLSASM